MSANGYRFPNSRNLVASNTYTANADGTEVAHLGEFVDLVVTLDVTALDRTSGDETYDLYITSGDGISEWDIIHFPQIASSGAKRFTAAVSGRVLPQNVTTASPGVSAVTTGTLATVSGGANAIKSLSAGIVRHGPWGDRINWHLVVGGTTPSITFAIWFTAKN